MFYVLLIAIPVTAAVGLVSLARAIDAAGGERVGVAAGLQAILAGVALTVLALAAALTSPLS